MFRRAKDVEKKDFSFGISQLDEMVDHRGGILLFRTNSRKFAFEVGSMALMKNMEEGKKEVLLHLVDYHERYWTIDTDRLMELAQKFGMDKKKIMDKINVIRAFNKGQMDSGGNWESIKDFVGEDTSLLMVDSMEELYNSKYSDDQEAKEGIRKLVSRLHQTSIECDCPVLLFDYSAGRLDSFLSQMACTVVNADVTDQGMALKVLKGVSDPNSQLKKKVEWRR